MSIRVMSLVWDSELTDIYEASVLLALANHADDDGRCYPSMARVAKLARCSLRKAQVVTKALVARGYLRVEMNSGPRGCNTYFLTLTPAQDAPSQGVHPRTSRQQPPHATTLAPAQCAPEPSKKHQRTRVSACAPDLPSEGLSDVVSLYAERIDRGKRIFGGMSDEERAQLIKRGYKLEQIQRAEGGTA
jgi:hypothetical protein